MLPDFQWSHLHRSKEQIQTRNIDTRITLQISSNIKTYHVYISSYQVIECDSVKLGRSPKSAYSAIGCCETPVSICPHGSGLLIGQLCTHEVQANARYVFPALLARHRRAPGIFLHQATLAPLRGLCPRTAFWLAVGERRSGPDGLGLGGPFFRSASSEGRNGGLRPKVPNGERPNLFKADSLSAHLPPLVAS